MRCVKSIVVVVSLAVLTACSGISNGPNGGTNPPPPTPDSISGTVTFKGVPLAGATATDFMTNTNTVFKTTVTDVNGHYAFSGMSVTGNVPGDFQIYVNKAGYGFYPSVGSGARVTRFDCTGQFLSSGLPPSGIFFNVIDFLALPESSASGANFAAYDGTNPPLMLAATGQEISYVAGDDASVHKGVAWTPAERFTDNGNGTVTDNLTGLVWLQDAGCLGSELWSDGLASVSQLASGACRLSDGSAVGDWRMPNLVELESLIDASAASPALSANHPFANVGGGVYWSSTSYYGGVGGSSKVWAIRMSDGRYMNDVNANIKASSTNAVWAVKDSGSAGDVQLQATGFYVPYADGDDGAVQAGVPLIFPHFIDHNDGTIIDAMTGLVWLKQGDCVRGQWSDALDSVNALASGQCGLTDGSTAGQWRMPNRAELLSLADRAQTNMAQYFDYTYVNKDGTIFQAPIFTNYIETKYYWTSTTNASDTTAAWTVYSCDFEVYDVPKTAVGYTLAVR